MIHPIVGADPSRKICVLTRKKFYSEMEGAHRLKRAGENLNWEVLIRDFEDATINEIPDLDWIMHLVPGSRKFTSARNYLAIYDYNWMFDSKRKFKKGFLSFDGFLMTMNERDQIAEDLYDSGNPIHYITWYPTVQKTDFNYSNASKLIYFLCVWGNRLTDKKYREFNQYLDKQKYAVFYGAPANKRYYPQSYKGTVPFDGVSAIERIREGGAVLILHSESHLNEGLPSGRIFEAAASSVVIISDRNQFVMDHFGDSVLYIDQTKSAKSMFQEVHRHMKWIQEHPEEAREKARRAHEIFLEEFNLEDQLLELEKMHEAVLLGV